MLVLTVLKSSIADFDPWHSSMFPYIHTLNVKEKPWGDDLCFPAFAAVIPVKQKEYLWFPEEYKHPLMDLKIQFEKALKSHQGNGPLPESITHNSEIGLWWSGSICNCSETWWKISTKSNSMTKQNKLKWQMKSHIITRVLDKTNIFNLNSLLSSSCSVFMAEKRPAVFMKKKIIFEFDYISFCVTAQKKPKPFQSWHVFQTCVIKTHTGSKQKLQSVMFNGIVPIKAQMNSSNPHSFRKCFWLNLRMWFFFFFSSQNNFFVKYDAKNMISA